MNTSMRAFSRAVTVSLSTLIALTGGVATAGDLSALFTPPSGKAIFVSRDGGSNENPGSREASLKNLDKAIKRAAAGDTILVAEGTYSEETDFNPESPANQWRSILGLNLQGKMTSSVSMYANRYPYQKALELFGSVSGVGAQSIQ